MSEGRIEDEFKHENYNEIIDNLMRLKDVLAHVPSIFNYLYYSVGHKA